MFLQICRVTNKFQNVFCRCGSEETTGVITSAVMRRGGSHHPNPGFRCCSGLRGCGALLGGAYWRHPRCGFGGYPSTITVPDSWSTYSVPSPSAESGQGGGLVSRAPTLDVFCICSFWSLWNLRVPILLYRSLGLQILLDSAYLYHFLDTHIYIHAIVIGLSYVHVF